MSFVNDPANERTFLAWVRSSLGAVVVGIAVVQIFRVSRDEQNAARYGKPLGISFDTFVD